MPVAEQTLIPQVVPSEEVQSRLQQNRDIQKQWYDKTSRPLPPLTKGQVVRLQTDKGHDHIGVISGTASEPRSFLVSADGGIYRRNRQHILPVNEPVPPPYYPDRTSVLPSVSSGIPPPMPAQQPTSVTADLPGSTSPAPQSPVSSPGMVVQSPSPVKPPALSPAGGGERTEMVFIVHVLVVFASRL